MIVVRLIYLFSLDFGYTNEHHLRRYQPLKQNYLVSKNSFHYSSSFAQDTCGRHELHFFPLCIQPPVQPNTSVEFISTREHGQHGDGLLKSCFPFVEQVREKPLQDNSSIDQKVFFYGIVVSKLHGTCISTE